MYIAIHRLLRLAALFDELADDDTVWGTDSVAGDAAVASTSEGRRAIFASHVLYLPGMAPLRRVRPSGRPYTKGGTRQGCLLKNLERNWPAKAKNWRILAKG